MITHIIFDMDGTLSDTALATEEAFKQCAPRFSMPDPPPGAVRRAMGYAGIEFYTHIYPGYTEESLQALADSVDAEESRIIRSMGPRILFDGVVSMLEALRAKGISLHIASTGSPEHVDDVLSTSGILPLFASVSCGQPEKVKMVGELLAGDDPKHWLMLGDKPKDFTAARGNGIMALGAGFGYVMPDEKSGFDAVLDTPGELLDYLSK